MTSPPGSGKTLLARSRPSILPTMTVEEALRGTRGQGEGEYGPFGRLRAGSFARLRTGLAGSERAETAHLSASLGTGLAEAIKYRPRRAGYRRTGARNKEFGY